MELKDAGKEAALAVVAVFKKKANDLWDSLTQEQRDDCVAILGVAAEDGVRVAFGDQEAKVRLEVNVNTLNDYRLKGGITAARLFADSMKEVLEVGVKFAIGLVVGAAKL